MELIPELMKLLRTKSMIRYLPPKGTAGLARSRVRGKRRVPLPPARTMPNTRRCKAPGTAKADSRSGILFSGNQPSQNSFSCTILPEVAPALDCRGQSISPVEVVVRKLIDNHVGSEARIDSVGA